MGWMWDNAVTLATVVMAIAAIAALVYAHLSISENRQAERRANANELWREILRLAFENPKLSDPTLGLAEFDYEAKTIDGSPELFQKYEMFVDTILNASEEILDVSPTKEWKASVRIQLLPHLPLFAVAALLAFRLHGSIHDEVPRLRRRGPARPCLSSSSTIASWRCLPASP